MISPTPRAVLLILSGLPLLIWIALALPSLWIVSAGWIMLACGLILVDAMVGPAARAVAVQISAPSLLYVGMPDRIVAETSFRSGPLPRRTDMLLETSELLSLGKNIVRTRWTDRHARAEFPVAPVRRGTGQLVRLWVRWQGPLGLIQKIHVHDIGSDIPITPNTRWVRDEAIRLFSRDAEFGIKTQIAAGDGSEFDALREFSYGMDRRAIDWKQSARHRHLVAKEFRTERNHNIVFAFDTGRLMSEPLDGIARIDRAVTAGLLLAYVSLRSGDRTMFYGFDAQPGLQTGFLSGPGSFPKAQNLLSRLDYSDQETNFTLAMTGLAQSLERRSLVIVFSDFVDTISAELMLENVRRLTKRHLVIFATFEDRMLSGIADRMPETGEDIARAVIADTLLSERDLVLRRLLRMGVHIIEAPPDAFGSSLVSAYLQIKQRDLL